MFTVKRKGGVTQIILRIHSIYGQMRGTVFHNVQL